MDEIINKHLILDELHRAFDKRFSASDNLDGKLQNMLNFLSIIVSIAPALEASTFLNKVGFVFWLALFVVLVLYLLAFRKIIENLFPSTYRQPISKDWDVLEKTLFHIKENDALNLLISEHITSMEWADNQNKEKGKAIREVSVLMTWIVTLLIIAVPLGLLLSNPILLQIFFVIQKFVIGK